MKVTAPSISLPASGRHRRWRTGPLSVLFLFVSSCLPPENNSPELQTAPAESPCVLSDVSTELGLDFLHVTGELQDYAFPSIMSGGAAFLDFDGDGRLDIYLVNGNDELSGGGSEPSDNPATNRLFRQTGDGHFIDATSTSGLGDAGFGMGVAVGDVNNDGFPDVYVTNYGPDRLYLNRRDGTFSDITESAGLENLHWSASASFLDYDRDGWLDLFVTNYVDYYAERACHGANGQKDFCGPQAFYSTADRLFRNLSGEQSASSADESPEEGVRFQDVSSTAGISESAGAGLGVACADFDGDGWTDVYVANDRMANFLWINQRDGTFVDEAVLRGAAFDFQGRPQASMGIAVGDVDGDDTLDLYVTHLEGETNALYLNRPGGLFEEASAGYGLLQPTFAYTGFGTAFADLDHDTALDLVVVNGRVQRSAATAEATEAAWLQYAERNLAFAADGPGRYREWAGALSPDSAEVSRGLATGDYDRDGDLDLLITNTAGPVQLLRNDGAESGGWLIVRAVDPQLGGRDAYGAMVTVIAGDSQWTRLIQPGGSYLSSSEPIAHFGLGTLETIDQIIVTWPDDVAERFSGGRINSRRVLERGQGQSL